MAERSVYLAVVLLGSGGLLSILGIVGLAAAGIEPPPILAVVSGTCLGAVAGLVRSEQPPPPAGRPGGGGGNGGVSGT